MLGQGRNDQASKAVLNKSTALSYFGTRGPKEEQMRNALLSTGEDQGPGHFLKTLLAVTERAVLRASLKPPELLAS